MKRRRTASVGWVGQALFLALLLAPVALRYTATEPADDAGAAAGLEASELAIEVARLRGALDAAREELDSLAEIRHDLEAVSARERFRAYVVDVLPIDDPAPSRAALWVASPAAHRAPPPPAGSATAADASPESLPRRSAAVAWRGALVGRTDPFLIHVPAVRVIELEDPSFRVRFRCGEQEGILRGTGKLRDGRALLEVLHTTPLGDLPDAAVVRTAGGDGVYPPGLLIGRVAPREEQTSGDQQEVHAHVDTSSLRHAVLFTDEIVRRAREAEPEAAFERFWIGGR